MSGRRAVELALLAPGSSGDGGGGDDDDHRQERMPGCMGLFARWTKRRAATSARTRRVADAPPPPPPAPPTRDIKDPTAVDIEEVADADIEELQAAAITELPSDIDCIIVSKLPSIYDRYSLQGVCGRWRNSAINCRTAPLPLIVNADYTLSNYFAEGADCVPQNMNPATNHSAGHPFTCLGSLGNWIAMGYEPEFDPQGELDLIHDECCLLQPIKGGLIHLPSPSWFRSRGGRGGSLQVLGGNGTFTYAQPARECRIRMQKVAVFRSPGLANFKIAALATQRGQNHLVFCTPDCDTWMISSADFITIGSDLEFMEEALFVLGNNQDELFLIQFGPHLCIFPTVSLVQRCTAIDIPIAPNTQQQRNLVRSAQDLLLVIRCFTQNWDQLTAVRVFQLDFDSFTWTEKRTLGSMSILISLSSSECIDCSAHEEISCDHVYFLDHFCPNFLPADNQQFSYRTQKYSMRTRAITEEVIGRDPASRRPGYPMWFFPAD